MLLSVFFLLFNLFMLKHSICVLLYYGPSLSSPYHARDLKFLLNQCCHFLLNLQSENVEMIPIVMLSRCIQYFPLYKTCE